MGSADIITLTRINSSNFQNKRKGVKTWSWHTNAQEDARLPLIFWQCQAEVSVSFLQGWYFPTSSARQTIPYWTAAKPQDQPSRRMMLRKWATSQTYHWKESFTKSLIKPHESCGYENSPEVLCCWTHGIQLGLIGIYWELSLEFRRNFLLNTINQATKEFVRILENDTIEKDKSTTQGIVI